MTINGLPVIPDITVPVLAGAIQSSPGARLQPVPSNATFAQPWYSFLSQMRSQMANFPPYWVTDPRFGARMDGSDDTGAVQNALNYVGTNGGGIIVIPAGALSYTSAAPPKNSAPIALVGAGAGATTLKRRVGLSSGVGMLDLKQTSNFWISDLTIDGGVTTPAGLRYNADFLGIGGNDPMADPLTRNTAIWIHGAASNIGLYRVRFQHTGGYSVIADATSGNVDGLDIINCWYENNRPSLFGTSPTNLNFGSWNGGILLKGDGRTAGSGRCSAVLVAMCRFRRNTGNCLWMHSYGLLSLHSGIRFLGNHFEDCGLDGIECGAVSGGAVEGNYFERIGYIALDDTGPATPRWLQNLNATALDSSGVVKGVPYIGNSFRSINGGCLDLDGHGESVITGNMCHLPVAGQPEYDEDQIAISGPNNNGSAMYGINTNNSADTDEGSAYLTISGNQFMHLPGGSMRLFAMRHSLVTGNGVISPDVPMAPPISYGPVGPGPNQRATGNKICHNRISYNPPTAAPAIFEDPSVSPFEATDINHVFGNTPIFPQGTLATEFEKDVNSGSPTYASTVWFP